MSVQHVSDYDSRLAYLPNDVAPSGCVDDATDPGCLSTWWFYNVSNITQHITAGPDTSMEFTFEGVGINLWGSTSSAGAVAHAAVDSGTDVVVNFASNDGEPHDNVLLFSRKGLGDGLHTLRLAYDNASFSKVNRKFLFVDWLEVFQEDGRRDQTSSTTVSATTAPISTTPQSALSQPSSAPPTVSVPAPVAKTVFSIGAHESTIQSADTVTLISISITPPSQRLPGSPETSQRNESAATNTSRLRIIIPAAVIGIAAILAIAFLGCVLRRRHRRRAHDKETGSRPPSPNSTYPFTYTPDDSHPVDTSPWARHHDKLNSILYSPSQRPTLAYEPSIRSMDSASTKVG